MRWLLALLALHAASAFALASRTYVSGVGDDANPCTFAQPCRTFARAITATASGGTVSAIDDASYGVVTIAKPVTIDGGGHAAAVLVASGSGILVDTTVVDDLVVLRSLSIDGLGTASAGIRALAVGKLIVEHCTIQNVAGHGIDFESASNPSYLLVSDSTVAGNLDPSGVSSGVYHAAPFGNVVLERVRVADNNIGVQLRTATMSIRDSIISDNVQSNVKLVAANMGRIDIDNSLIAGSLGGTGIYSQGLVASVYLSNSTVTGNNQGLVTVLGAIDSFGNNRIFGNTTDGAVTTTLPQK